MKRQKKLESKAREVIIEMVSENPSMPIEDVMDIIRPHFLFDPQTAKEREIRQLANRTAACVRDEKGIRDVYAINNQFVNVTKTTEKEMVTKIRKRQEKFFVGNGLSLDKLNFCEMLVNEQIILQEEAK